MTTRQLMKGNEALCRAAIDAGCSAFFGYPITPQNQVPEYLSYLMPKHGRVFLQAESELAAINMVYGAAATGVRVMTSSSSPGISLKQEGISYIACAELPAVIDRPPGASPELHAARATAHRRGQRPAAGPGCPGIRRSVARRRA